MSRILSWWSKTTHLSVRSSFLPDLNLTRDNDVQEKVFPRLGLGSMLRPYSHLAQTQPLSSQPNISIKSRPRPSSSEPSPAQSCYSRPLIELAFTLRLHCWNLFRIYDKDSLPGHGRGHMGLAVRFAGIFGNNVWPPPDLGCVTWPSRAPYLLFTSYWFGKFPCCMSFISCSISVGGRRGGRHNVRWIATITRQMVCGNLPISNRWESFIEWCLLPSGWK